MRWLQRFAERLTSKHQESPPLMPSAPATPNHRAEARALVNKAANLRSLGNLDGAIAVLGQAIEVAPNEPEIYYARGLAHSVADRHDDAIADFDRALALRPLYPEALTERGLAYVNRGSLTRGIADYDAALRIDPAYAIALDNKGSALCLKHLWTHALPLLDRALRLVPTSVNALQNRSVAHELLGDPGRALADLEIVGKLAGSGAQRLVSQRLGKLRARAGDKPRAWSVTDEMWTEYVTLSQDHTVAELLAAVREHDAYQVVLPLAGGGHAVVPVYEASGLRVRLTEIADLVGPAILELRLVQLLDPLVPCVPIERSATREQAMQAMRDSGGRTLIVEEGQILGVLEGSTDYDRPELPTTLFGAETSFGRNAEGQEPRSRPGSEPAIDRDVNDPVRPCAGCAESVGYYRPTLTAGKLTGIACPRCGRDPIPDWIEDRMRPGRWSRAGFLGPTERLHDVIERDARTVLGLGVTHVQIAGALDRLLDGASSAYEPRIARAARRLHEQMLVAGSQLLDNEVVLELEPSLDDVVRLLDRGELPLESQGVLIDGFQVFLKVYVGYQACPWTMLRRPYCAAEPRCPMQVSCVKSVRLLSPVVGAAMPCAHGVTFLHGDRDFLILDRSRRNHLRGSGLLPHLIRDHRFFEGEHSPYRLDPARIARVLGLTDS